MNIHFCVNVFFNNVVISLTLFPSLIEESNRKETNIVVGFGFVGTS